MIFYQKNSTDDLTPIKKLLYISSTELKYLNDLNIIL